jgi:hypothetical protein
MTKAELIAEIETFYDYVGIPFESRSTDQHVPAFIKTYSVIVFETGLSEKSKKPVLKNKYVSFVVYNENEVDEAAYYSDEELKNDVNTDITGDNTLESINKIYISETIRGRVRAAVSKAAQDVLNESLTSSSLTSNADSAQKNVVVESGALFWVGKVVAISDSLNSEQCTIASIDSNTLTMAENLVNSYTTANSAKVTYVDNKERQRWAVNAVIDPDAYTLAMTNFVALNPTVQLAGGLATDNDIQFIINSFINKLAYCINLFEINPVSRVVIKTGEALNSLDSSVLARKK